MSPHDEGARRDDSAPSAPAAWADRIVRLDAPDRAKVLGRLLGFVGPLALAVLGGGVFAKYLRFARNAVVPVTPDDAARATPGQIQELLRYVQQSHPGSAWWQASCARLAQVQLPHAGVARQHA